MSVGAPSMRGVTLISSDNLDHNQIGGMKTEDNRHHETYHRSQGTPSAIELKFSLLGSPQTPHKPFLHTIQALDVGGKPP